MRSTGVVMTIVAAARVAAAEPSTVEVCRETQKVLDQYKREIVEADRLVTIKNNDAKWQKHLDELRKAIKGKFLMSGLDEVAAAMGLPDVGEGTRARLALQEQLRDIVSKGLTEARANKLRDLEARRDRVAHQIETRQQRLSDLDCNAVLARESAAGCGAGKSWTEEESGYKAVWTRDGGGDASGGTYTAVYTAPDGHKETTHNRVTVNGDAITISRVSSTDTQVCSYTGTITNKTQVRGTYKCPQAWSGERPWTAAITCP